MAAVAVVGAGIAGLTAAYRLKRMGYRVVVYEASERAGGVIRTERREGYLAELGPNSMAGRRRRRHRADHPAGSRLLAGRGLSARRKNRYIVRRGSWSRFPPPPRSCSPPACSRTAPSWRSSASHGRARRLADGGERRDLRASAVQPGGPRLRRQSVRRGNLRRRSRAALRPPRPAAAARSGAHPRLGDEGGGADAARGAKSRRPGWDPRRSPSSAGSRRCPTRSGGSCGPSCASGTRDPDPPRAQGAGPWARRTRRRSCTTPWSMPRRPTARTRSTSPSRAATGSRR